MEEHLEERVRGLRPRGQGAARRVPDALCRYQDRHRGSHPQALAAQAGGLCAPAVSPAHPTVVRPQSRADPELEDRLTKELTELVDRFYSIRQQGETLLETFSKMHEALDRRLATEQQRQQQFASQGAAARSAEVEEDVRRIQRQMQTVALDESRVKDLYEEMKTKELNYRYLTHREDEVDEEDQEPQDDH